MRRQTFQVAGFETEGRQNSVGNNSVNGTGAAMRKIGFATAALIAFTWSLPAFAQSAPKKYLSTASTNSTLVMAGASGSVGGPAGVLLKTLVIGNSSAATTPLFLKLYNKATSPICGTDIPVQTIPVQVAPTPTLPIDFGNGMIFPLGLGFCLTGAIADNDPTAAAVGVAINFGVSGR
jgi:hypothetical protein